MEWVCYVLMSLCPQTRMRTYVGATCNLKRRMRQHNGLIAGGAKSTRRSRPWRLIAFVSGFSSRQQCLSFEYRVKRLRACAHIVCDQKHLTNRALLRICHRADTTPTKLHLPRLSCFSRHAYNIAVKCHTDAVGQIVPYKILPTIVFRQILTFLVPNDMANIHCRSDGWYMLCHHSWLCQKISNPPLFMVVLPGFCVEGNNANRNVLTAF